MATYIILNYIYTYIHTSYMHTCVLNIYVYLTYTHLIYLKRDQIPDHLWCSIYRLISLSFTSRFSAILMSQLKY